MLLTVATGATWPLARRQEAFNNVTCTDCPMCGLAHHTDFHTYWGCGRLEDSTNHHIVDTQNLVREATTGVEKGDRCFWLRGLVPSKWTRPTREPIEWEEPIGTGTQLTGKHVTIYTDGSGGRSSNDPRIRRCGWAWCTMLEGRVHKGEKGHLFLPQQQQTVGRSEIMAGIRAALAAHNAIARQ